MGELGQGDIDLYRLAYVSDIVPCSIETLDFTLREILIQSLVLNNRDNITGFLITFRGWFAQALEGPSAAVEACYARIAADLRHARPEVTVRGPIERRQFPQWSMCGMTLSARDAAVLELAEQAFDLDLRAASPQALVQFLDLVSRRYNGQLERLYRAVRVD